jgi:hypothetical protein
MTDDPQPQKIPLISYRAAAGSEPVREWLKGLDEAAPGDREGPAAGAMAVAGGHAAVPPNVTPGRDSETATSSSK